MGGKPGTPYERALRNSERLESGCLVFMGSRDHKGYGKVSAPHSNPPASPLKVHRVSWEHHHGPIPDGAWVLHKCDTPACFEPEHLYLGDHLQNMADLAERKRHHNILKTHCPAGHPYDEENTLVSTSPTSHNGTGRYCRKCHYEASKRYRLKNRVRPEPYCLTCGRSIPETAHGRTRYCDSKCWPSWEGRA